MNGLHSLVDESEKLIKSAGNTHTGGQMRIFYDVGVG
jgi:hypothetical protein